MSDRPIDPSLTGSVLAQVTATIVKPRDDRPYEGFLLINSEISPMASSAYENGRCVTYRLLLVVAI